MLEYHKKLLYPKREVEKAGYHTGTVAMEGKKDISF
jgi:hypothetical protein